MGQVPGVNPDEGPDQQSQIEIWEAYQQSGNEPDLSVEQQNELVNTFANVLQQYLIIDQTNFPVEGQGVNQVSSTEVHGTQIQAINTLTQEGSKDVAQKASQLNSLAREAGMQGLKLTSKGGTHMLQQYIQAILNNLSGKMNGTNGAALTQIQNGFDSGNSPAETLTLIQQLVNQVVEENGGDTTMTIAFQDVPEWIPSN